MLEFVIFALYRQISGTIAMGYNCVDCEWREKVLISPIFFTFCQKLSKLSVNFTLVNT